MRGGGSACGTIFLESQVSFREGKVQRDKDIYCLWLAGFSRQYDCEGRKRGKSGYLLYERYRGRSPDLGKKMIMLAGRRVRREKGGIRTKQKTREEERSTR